MDDIISKSQMELRKSLFGDDSEEVRHSALDPGLPDSGSC